MATRKALAAADPEIPAGIFNRQADNWRALLAVADAAGGEWPNRARQVALGSAAALGGDTSARVSLLSDIRDIFEAKGMERVYSQDLVDALVALEGRPWSEWRNGKPISATGMAKLLAPFHIHPDDIRSGAKVAKGYKRDTFNDAFARYLVDTPDPTATALQPAETLGFSTLQHPLQEDSRSGSVPPENPKETAACSGVAVENPLDGDGETEWTA